MLRLLNNKMCLIVLLILFYLKSNLFSSVPQCSQNDLNKESILCTNVQQTKDLHSLGLLEWKKLKIVNDKVKQLELNGIPEEFQILEDIDVSQAGNLILTENAFANLPNLKKLNLSNCNIESLENSQLSAASNLKNLDASWNMLKNLKFDTDKKLQSLEIANFSHNEIQSIDAEEDLQKLKILYLDFNELKKISLRGYTNLNVFTMSDNLVEKLTSNSFGNLPSIQEFSITSSPLNQIEDRTFESMTDLKNLNLSANSIEKLSSHVFSGLNRLIQLDLNSNNLEELAHFQFQHLIKLQYLDISRNSLKSLNSSHFNNLSNLRKLFINDNDIEEIQSHTFANLNSMDTLDLSNNNIEYLDADVFGEHTLPRLRKLLLKSNSLKSLHPLAFASLPFLQYLSMGFNELTSLDVRMFAPMRRLEKLHLGNNLLETISGEVLESLTDITELLLDRNRLSFLSNSNATFAKLERVTLEGNPWQCPCWDEMAKWLEDRGVSYIRPHSPYFRGQKPLCVVTPVDFCVKNLRLVKEHKIEEIFNSG